MIVADWHGVIGAQRAPAVIAQFRVAEKTEAPYSDSKIRHEERTVKMQQKQSQDKRR